MSFLFKGMKEAKKRKRMKREEERKRVLCRGIRRGLESLLGLVLRERERENRRKWKWQPWMVDLRFVRATPNKFVLQIHYYYDNTCANAYGKFI